MLSFSASCGRVSQDIFGVLFVHRFFAGDPNYLMLLIYATGSVYVSTDDKMIMKV